MTRVFLAYDGSLNAEWVSHYAIRMARHQVEPRLSLLQVTSPTDVAAPEGRLEHLARECELAGVRLEREVIGLGRVRSVTSAILEAVPHGQESFLLCGTRVRPKGQGLLAGTVSAGLLAAAKLNVMAIRVVEPGLLGLPRRLLVPVAGHPRGFASGMPFLRLMAPDISRIIVLHVKELERLSFSRLSAHHAKALVAEGQRYVERVEREITEELGDHVSLDGRVVISDDAPKEILIAANRHRCRLLYMGATERTLRERLFYGSPIEQVLRNAPCDVAIYRGVT